jgi:hypothetical protein
MLMLTERAELGICSVLNGFPFVLTTARVCAADVCMASVKGDTDKSHTFYLR